MRVKLRAAAFAELERAGQHLPPGPAVQLFCQTSRAFPGKRWSRAYPRFWKAPRHIPPQPALRVPRPWATFATSLFKGQLYGGSTARRLHRVPAYSTMKEAVALVDAALSYLTRMAFRSSLSGDVPNMARDFSCPGRPFPRERCNSFWSKPLG